MDRMARRGMTFDRLWVWIAVALPAIISLIVPLPAVDLAYQVRAGNEILASGAIPRADTWTFTVYGTAWTDQQWLAQVVLAVLHGLGGWELLAVLRATLVAGTTGLLVAVGLGSGARPRTAAILALAAFALAAPALALRPQLFGIVLAAGLLWLVVRRADHPRWLVVGAPVLVALWANLHGSFVLAPVVLGWAWLDDLVARHPARASLWALVLGTAATLANPFTIGAWLYAAGMGTNAVISAQVSEWQRTSPFEFPGLLYYPSVAVVLLLLARTGRKTSWPTWLFAAALAAMGAWAVRGVAWWAMAMVPLAAGALASNAGAGPNTDRAVRVRPASAVNALTAAVLGLVLVLALPWWRPGDPLTGRAGLLAYAPGGLALAVRDRVPPGARVLVPQTWGSWFEWAAPDHAYFVDSRFELFPADIWADLAAFPRGDGEAVLDRWRVEAVVSANADWSGPAGWTRVHQDVDGSLWVRSP